MKMPYFPILFIYASVFFLLVGCTSTTTQVSVVPLKIDAKEISVSFQQNGKNMAALNQEGYWKVTLRPEPFTIIINGDKKIVSISALHSEDLVAPLLQSSKPLVTVPLYTGNGFSSNNLSLSYQPLSFITVDSPTLQGFAPWSFSSKQATEIANTLKNQFGTEPLALVSSHAYLTDQEQNYLIKTINGNEIQKDDSIVLLVFIEKPSNDPLFIILKWLVFTLEFK